MNTGKHAWYWKFIALGLAGVLDLAAGTVFVHLLGVYFSYPLLWWQYVIGAFLAASPDIDLLLSFFGKEPMKHHENLTHRPLFGIFLAVLLGWLLGGKFWAHAAGIGVCWHYLHDTQGFLGFYDNGIGWFWPFSDRYWGVKHLRVVAQTLNEFLEGKKGGFTSIYEDYLTPTRRSVTELILAGMFFGYVTGGLFGLYSGFTLVTFFWLAIAMLWIVYHRVAHV